MKKLLPTLRDSLGRSSICAGVIATFLVAVCGLAGVSLAGQAASVSVQGTTLRVAAGDGRIVEGKALTGAILTIAFDGVPVRTRIASVIEDPKSPGGEVLLYDLQIVAKDGSERPLCNPDPDGKRLGFPLAGHTDASGALQQAEGFEFVCTAGAQGKCVRFGYGPWLKSKDGQSLRNHYNACVRMVRADYCGNAASFTRDGTVIGFGDHIGLNRFSKGDETAEGQKDFQFEASWDEDGAVCVAHPRIEDLANVEAIQTACPRLLGKVGVNACSLEKAQSLGGLIDNYSR